MTDFVDPRDVPSDVAAPAQPFIDPRDVRSAGGEIGAAVERGVRGDFATTVGKALQYTGKPGDKLYDTGSDIITRAQGQTEKYAPQEAQHGDITNFVAKGAQTGAAFLPAIAAGAMAPEAGLAGLGISGAVAAPYAMQAGQETYEKSIAAGQSEEEAKAAGREAAAMQGATMTLVPGAVGKAAQLGGKLLPGAANASAAAARELTAPTAGKTFAKGAATGAAGNVAMMEAGAAGQAGVEQAHGLSDQTPLEAAKEALPGALGAAALFTPLAALHASKTVAQGKASVQAITSALADPKAPPEMRAQAVRHVYDAMEKADPDGANMWAINAGEALHAGAPIGTDASWTEGPHASVFPEAAQPTKALPAPGSVAPDLGSESTPFPLAAQHGNQNAVDDNEARWAARDAAEKARLQASGPLGQAAAAGMDSGAVSHMAEQRAGEVPPGEPPEPPEGGSPQDQQAQANITAWTRSTAPLSLQDAQRNAAAIAEGGKPYTVVPHPQGGYAVVPDHLITPTLAEQFAGLQRAGQLPAPGSDVPGRMTSKEGRAPVATTYGELPPADTAERTRLFPFPTPEAAQNRADAMTMRTGTEHEVIPHPYARDKFAVQEKQSFTDREPTTGASDAVQEPGAGSVLQRESEQAGVAGGERGRVEPGLEREEAPREGQAAGEEESVGERLHQNPIAEEHGIGFESPDGRSQMAIEHGVRPMKDDERAATETLLKATQDAGHDVGLLSGAHLTATEPVTHGDSTKPTNGPMSIFAKQRTIVIRADILRAINRGTKMLPQMVGWLRHEGWHLADIKNKDGEFASSTHPAFEIKTDADGNRTAHGGIMQEAFDAWHNGTDAKEHLDYPFRDWDGDYKDFGDSSHQKLSERLQNEVFAQLGRMHDMHPDVMKRELPKAYELFERIKDGAKQSDAADATQRSVQQTLRSTGALRGASDHVVGADRSEDTAGAGRREPGPRMVRETLVDSGEGRPAGERSEARRPALIGLPKSSPGPFEPARKAAAAYMAKAGLEYNPPTHFARVDPEHAADIARAYAEMKHDPDDPKVKSAYRALIKETIAQWHAMMDTGIKIDFTDKDHPYPYKNPHDAVADVRKRNHLWVYSTTEGFGSDAKFDPSQNPLLAKSGIVHNGKELLANDVFRAIHDYFGHIKEGVGFRHDGEENAWRSHVGMFSENARQAMTSETRGQNSWLNWGPHGDKNRTASEADTIYADQKTGLLPKKFTKDNYAAGLDQLPPELAAALTPQEQRLVGEGRGRAERLLALLDEMTSRPQFEAAARAGGAAKGWYARSLQAIQRVYGADHQRFLQLMAALSPQTNVKGNFYNAARVFAAWEKAGRTNDTGKLQKIFRDNLVTDQGREDGKSAMAAWAINGTRVLTAADPNKVKLSGPKVSSFMANLLGHYVEVTNDRHMADFAGIDQKHLAGDDGPNKISVKSPGYIALSARVRQTAGKLGWSPAETQAAIWSWWNSLKRLSKATGKSAVQLIRDGELTADRIAQEPHLGSYLNEQDYRTIDPDRGSRAEGSVDGQGDEVVGQGSNAPEEGSGSAPSRALEANARRIDRNLAASEAKKQATLQANRENREPGGINDEHGNPYFVRDANDRNLDEPHPPFYSGMDKAIAEKAPFSKSGEIDAKMLGHWLEARTKEGLVKRDELEWTGLGDYLKTQDGKVTRDQVQQFLDRHGVKVEEHVLGENAGSEGLRSAMADAGLPNSHGDANRLMTRWGSIGRHVLDDFDVDESHKNAMDSALRDWRDNTQTKFSDYQLPGGKNYRELLLTLPSKENSVEGEFRKWMSAKGVRNHNVVDLSLNNNSSSYWNQFKHETGTKGVAPGVSNFTSSHYQGHQNLLAHVRFNERTDANGKKVLFIEELQSDWAQKGRKEGFATGQLDQERAADHAKAMSAVDAYRDQMRDKYGAPITGAGYFDKMMAAERTHLQNLVSAMQRLDPEHNMRGVPPAPFVGKTEAWTALALKRMIRYAADNGFDRVAWTSGEQQTDRYDLGKHIDHIGYRRNNDGTYAVVARKNSEGLGNESVWRHEDATEKMIEDTFGKEIAKKIVEGPVKGKLSGLDLRVGGEGMKAFYDKIVPNVANDVLKKLGGGRVDDGNIGQSEHAYAIEENPAIGAQSASYTVHLNGVPVEGLRDFKSVKAAQSWIDKQPISKHTGQPGFDITPSMRAKVKEGQPLFVRDAADGNFDKVPDRELAPKMTGGKAAEHEQQFTKSGDPVSPAPDKLKPEWIAKASPEAQAFLQKAGVYVPKKSWRERWTELKKDMGLKILQQTVDQYRPVLEKIGKYPYQLLRMASAHDAGLAALVQNGHVEMNKWGALRVKAGTQSFKDIMAPLAGEGDRMLAWMAAQRANELMKEGREHNFTQEEINAGLKLNTELHGDDKFRGEGTRAVAYTKAMKGFHEMNQSVLDVAEHAGILDPEARKAFSREFYVPFFREQDGEREVNPSNISGMVNQYATKRLKGGEEGLHDLMANTMQNWSHLLSASLKNNAAWQTLQHAEDLGIATKIKAAEAGKGSVYVLQDGKEVHYIVHDQLVANAISSLAATPMRGPIMRGLGMMKHALTVGTTWSPIFRIRHTIREQITALAANPTGYNPVKNWIDGFKYSSKNNPEYGNMAAGGAFFHMGLDLEGNRAAYVKRLIAHEIDPKSLVDSEHKALQLLGHMADWWKETGERSDSITRANLYRQTFARMVAEGHDAERAHFEASYVARDAMDYSLHGINPAIRMITQVVPFMNARMQGLYKLGRGAAEDPKRFAAVVGGITLATIALSLAQRKDKDVQNASEWDRDNNWLIKVGNVMYRVPKPFEVGAVATVADRALEAVMNGLHPSDRERFAARLMPILGAQLNLNPIPQALFPALELWANKNVFSGTQIEPGRDERLSTAQHIGPNTSLTAQALGSAGVLSPEQIDFAVGAYLGWVGTHVVNTVDLALRATGQFPTKAAPRLDDFFLVGDFAHQLPSNQSRFVEEYYQHMKDVQTAFGDLRMLQQTGQLQKAAELMKSKGDEIGLHGMYLRTQREIGQLNRRGRYVQMSNMDADAKRVELDRIAQVKNSLATIAEKTRAQAVDNPQRTR